MDSLYVCIKLALKDYSIAFMLGDVVAVIGTYLA